MAKVVRADGVSHSGITAADRKRIERLERRPSGGGGATGFAAFSYSTHVAIASPAAPTALSSGWSQDDDKGVSGMTLVSGQPSYAPGLYISNAYVQANALKDGTVYSVGFHEAVIGGVQSTFLGPEGDPSSIELVFSGIYYWTADTTADVSVSYVARTAGTNGLDIYSVQLYVCRLGDAPA